MNVLTLLLFFGGAFTFAAIAFFLWSAKEGTFERCEHLSLLPLESDEAPKGDLSK